MEKPPINEVLEAYGAEDIPTGYRFRKIRCPFHDDRSPSASVNVDENRFRCFSCDISGDSYDVISWKEGCRDFRCARECAEKLLGRSYGTVQRGPEGARKRRGVFEESGPVRGQRSLLQARSGRKPLAGA